MVTKENLNKSVRMTRDDVKIVREIERQLEPKHGKLSLSQIVRMALRSLAESNRQQAA